MFRLMPDAQSSLTSSAAPVDQFLVKMDNDAIRSCIDKAHDDRVKLNFDVNEFDSETINIQTVGNKIEVRKYDVTFSVVTLRSKVCRLQIISPLELAFQLIST